MGIDFSAQAQRATVKPGNIQRSPLVQQEGLCVAVSRRRIDFSDGGSYTMVAKHWQKHYQRGGLAYIGARFV